MRATLVRSRGLRAMHVAADVAGRDAVRTQACDHHVREILAHTAAFAEDLVNRGRDGGRALVVFEIGEDAMAKVDRRLEHRPTRRKRRRGIRGKRGRDGHSRRIEDELERFESCAGLVPAHFERDLFPRWRQRRMHGFEAMPIDQTLGGDDEGFVRFMNREVRDRVTEIVVAGDRRIRQWSDPQPMFERGLIAIGARLQMDFGVRYRNRIAVAVGGRMDYAQRHDCY